jgi:putative oxidoreductase
MRTWDVALLVGRLLFGGFFLYSALNHFTNTESLAAYAASQGVPLPTLAVLGTGLLLLLGGASVLLGAWPRVGLALIALFLVGVTPAMHPFWTFDNPARAMAETTNFAKNVALLGAALGLLAVPTPWAWSVGERFGRPARERRRTMRPT